jgi:hypothetical protein
VALEIQTFVKAVRVSVKSQRRPRQKAALTDERFQPSCRGRRRLVRRRGLSRTHRRILSTILVEERPSTRGIKTTRPPRAFTRSPPTTWSSALYEDVRRNRVDQTDLLVAVLMARPDITSVSDLTGKTIAIDNRYSASNGSVRTAIVAAGAPEIQLSEGRMTAIDRLVNGEVPAAVLALVSADAAEGFPEIAGFKIFHIPLSPRSLKARP